MAEVLKITILCMTVLLLAVGVLLALPRSQLRSFLLEALGWGRNNGEQRLGSAQSPGRHS
jgi:branched-subunit amino acid permease